MKYYQITYGGNGNVIINGKRSYTKVTDVIAIMDELTTVMDKEDGMIQYCAKKYKLVNLSCNYIMGNFDTVKEAEDALQEMLTYNRIDSLEEKEFDMRSVLNDIW